MAKSKYRSRALYAAVGCFAGMVVATILYFTGLAREIFFAFGLIGGLAALWWGERRRKIRTVDEENRPMSLFDDSGRRSE